MDGARRRRGRRGRAGLDDPLRPDEDEADRIARAGQLIGMGTFTWTPAPGRLVWSQKMSEILGYHAGFANSSRARWFDRIHPADREAFWQAVEETFESCNLQDIVMRVVRPQSATRYVRFYMQVLTHECGAPRGVIATAQDVSDKVFAEKEAERLKQRCETILTRLEEHDPVTTLLNWRGFDNEVDRARRIGPGAVLLLRIEAVRRPSRPGRARVLGGLHARHRGLPPAPQAGRRRSGLSGRERVRLPAVRHGGRGQGAGRHRGPGEPQLPGRRPPGPDLGARRPGGLRRRRRRPPRQGRPPGERRQPPDRRGRGAVRGPALREPARRG